MLQEEHKRDHVNNPCLIVAHHFNHLFKRVLREANILKDEKLASENLPALKSLASCHNQEEEEEKL